MADDYPRDRARGRGSVPNNPPGRNNRERGQRMLTAVEAEEDILRISRTIDDLLEDLAKHGREMAEAKHAYKLAQAKRNLLARDEEGSGRGGRTTVDEREALVLVDTDQLWLKYLLTEAMWEVDKERLHAMRDQLGSLQTICANIRAMAS